MAQKWHSLSKNQISNLKRVKARQDISTIAAVDLEALRLVTLRDTNDGTEVWLTDRGRVSIMTGRVLIEV
jgi:hypothetical protein